jgi:S-layer protein
VVVDSYNTAAITGNALQNVTLKNSAATGATVTTTQTALNLTVDDVDGSVNLDQGAASITNLTLNLEGANSTFGAGAGLIATLASNVTINAGANLTMPAATTVGSAAASTAVTVTGSGTVDLTNIGAANLTTINAATNTGGVTATATGVATQFTGGAGADNLTLVAGTTATTTMGAGNDTVVMTTLGAGGTVDGGEGTADVLSTTVANAIAASANGTFDAAVTNFERLLLNTNAGNNDAIADTFTVNLANLTYDYVTVQGSNTGTAADTLALTGMAANGTINVAANGVLAAGNDLYTVTLADATGAADVLNMIVTSADSGNNFASAGLNAGTITATGVETYNVSSTTADADGSAGNTLAANEGTAGVLTTINVSGNTALTLTSNATAVTTVDASAATGALTYTANDGTTTVTGGAGADILTGAGNSDVLIGGAGNDQLTGDNLTTLTGGEGNDTFFMNMPTNVNSYSTITDLSAGDVIDFRPGADAAAGTGTIAFQSAAVVLAGTAVFQDYANAAVNTLGTDGDDVAWFQFGGDTYIVQSGNGVAGNDFVNGQDSIIKITGAVDLSTASYNQDAGTLEIA